MPVLQTWSHPATKVIPISMQLGAFVTNLQNNPDNRGALLVAVGHIIRELVDRGDDAKTPYVITVDQTQGGMGIASLQAMVNHLVGQPLPQPLGQQITIMANPSNRYRILTQVGNDPQQVRVEVFT